MLSLSIVSPQLALMPPTSTPCVLVVWAMTPRLKCSLCVEIRVGEFRKVSVGKAGEKRGDVGVLLATTQPSNHFHAKEIRTKLRLG